MFSKKRATPKPTPTSSPAPDKESTPSVGGMGNDAVKSSIGAPEGGSDTPLLDGLEAKAQGPQSPGLEGSPKGAPKAAPKLSGIGRFFAKALNTKDWRDEQEGDSKEAEAERAKQEDAIDAGLMVLNAAQLLGPFRALTLKALRESNDADKAAFVEDYSGDCDPEYMYDTYIAAGAPMQVNLPGSITETAKLCAEFGVFDSIDFAGVYKIVSCDISENQPSSLKHDPEARELMAAMLPEIAKKKADEAKKNADDHKQRQFDFLGKQLDASHVLGDFRGVFFKQLRINRSDEVIGYIEDFEAAFNAKTMYETYLDAKGPLPINVPGKSLVAARSLAKSGDYDQIDFVGIQETMIVNQLADVRTAIANDPEAMALVETLDLA